MIPKFQYKKPFKEFPDDVIRDRLIKLFGNGISDDLLKFFCLNKGGEVDNAYFIYKGEKYSVICVPGFGSKHLLENIEFNYEGVTKSYHPDMLEVIQLADEESILCSLNNGKFYFEDYEGNMVEIASDYSGLMEYFEEDR